MRFSTLATISVAVLAFATANVSASRGGRLSRGAGVEGVVGNAGYIVDYRHDAEGALGDAFKTDLIRDASRPDFILDASRPDRIRDALRPGIIRTAARGAAKVAGAAVGGAAKVAGTAVGSVVGGNVRVVGTAVGSTVGSTVVGATGA